MTIDVARMSAFLKQALDQLLWMLSTKRPVDGIMVLERAVPMYRWGNALSGHRRGGVPNVLLPARCLRSGAVGKVGATLVRFARFRTLCSEGTPAHVAESAARAFALGFHWVGAHGAVLGSGEIANDWPLSEAGWRKRELDAFEARTGRARLSRILRARLAKRR